MNSGWIVEAICLLDAVEAIEHRFSREKSAMYAIERSLWRFVEPGGIVADPDCSPLGMLEYSTPELVDG